jgi:hypothetical protein
MTGSNGGTAAIPGTGGTTSFSINSDTVSLTVTPVNDAPVATGSATLTSINEDSVSGSISGATVSTLFSSNFSDSTDEVGGAGGSVANTLAGVVVVGNSASVSQGVWEFRKAAEVTWTAIGARTTANGRYLDDADLIRFVPAENFNGTPTGLTVRLADNSTDAVASGTESIDVSDDSTKSGGSTRYSSSANSVTLNTSVTAINDAPTRGGASADLNVYSEDTPEGSIVGSTVSTRFSSITIFNDNADLVTSAVSGGSSANAFAGVVVVANTANAATMGTWQFKTGSTGAWTDIGPRSASNGR